jgi:hypothetical protein
MLRIHPELKGRVGFTVAACLTLKLLGIALLVAVAAQAGVVAAVPRAVTLTAGCIFLALGTLGMTLWPRWYQRATRVVESERPVHASVRLRVESDSDSTSLFADIARIEGAALADPAVPLLLPRWPTDAVAGQRLDVSAWRDPESGKVLALETPWGRIWSMPHWGKR